jgi:Probable cobalt transporter subunit (CbtA)
MVGALLARGMLSGVLAGLVACGFASVFGEPHVALAIAFEQHARAVAGAAQEPELVSRAVQSSAGLLTGILVYGSALGGIFALVFAYAYGRLGRSSPRATAAILAALGFGALILVPQLKYPANPPAIGNPETIGERTALYFTMILFSVAAAVAATTTARQLARRLGEWNGAMIGVAGYLVVATAAMLILPRVNEVPAGFPATTLWNFRVAGLGTEAVLWVALGLIFGVLAERRLSARADAVGRPAITIPARGSRRPGA